MPSYWRDRTALIVYRLRAARYGFYIRLKRPFADLLGLGGLTLAILGIALTLQVDWTVAIPAVGGPHLALRLCLVGLSVLMGLWIGMRYLGSLSGMMRIAAASRDAAELVRKNMAKGMQNSCAYDAIVRLYCQEVDAANARLSQQGFIGQFIFVPDHSQESQSRRYATIALELGETSSLENVLGEICSDLTHTHQFLEVAESRQALMRTWRSRQSSLRSALGDETGNNYYLRRLRIESPGVSRSIAIDVGVATYGQIVRSCDSLINEFALQAYLARGLVSWMRTATYLSCLPWRERTHRRSVQLGDLFLEPGDRAAGIGVSVATLLTADQTVVALGMRSAEVGTYPACLHVIPAGMCNTHGTESTGGQRRTAVPSWYLTTAMKSEFLEEWYDDQKLEQGRVVNWRDYVQKSWQRHCGRAAVKLTGLAFDLLNLRPEVCAEVTIQKYGGELCWEYIAGQPHEEFSLDAIATLGAHRLVQSGAAAVSLLRKQ